MDVNFSSVKDLGSHLFSGYRAEPPVSADKTSISAPVDGFVKSGPENTSTTIKPSDVGFISSVSDTAGSYGGKAFTAAVFTACALSGIAGPVSAQTADFSSETAVYQPLELNRNKAEKAEVQNDATGTATVPNKSYFRGEGFFKEIDKANYETQVGDYTLKVDYVDSDFDIKPRISPKLKDGHLQIGGKLYLKGENDFLKTELSKEFQQGDWQVTQGIRGGIDTEFRLGYEGQWKDNGGESTFSHTPISEAQVHVSGYGFRTYNRNLDNNKHLRLDFVAGVDHEFVDNNTTVHLAARQELTGGNLEIMGEKFTWMMEAKQGISQNLQDGHTGYNYELFAGLGKKFPMKIFGRETQLEVKVGPKLHGNENDSFGVKPVLKVKVRF